jgi:hypothetical protein
MVKGHVNERFITPAIVIKLPPPWFQIVSISRRVGHFPGITFFSVFVRAVRAGVRSSPQLVPLMAPAILPIPYRKRVGIVAIHSDIYSYDRAVDGVQTAALTVCTGDDSKSSVVEELNVLFIPVVT